MKIIEIEGKKYLQLTKEQFKKLGQVLFENEDSQKDGSFVYNLCCVLEDYVE